MWPLCRGAGDGREGAGSRNGRAVCQPARDGKKKKKKRWAGGAQVATSLLACGGISPCPRPCVLSHAHKKNARTTHTHTHTHTPNRTEPNQNQCAGIHRSLGTHISKVRSATLDTWLPSQVRWAAAMGNARAASYWEARLPAGFSRPAEGDMAALSTFIGAKYR